MVLPERVSPLQIPHLVQRARRSSIDRKSPGVIGKFADRLFGKTIAGIDIYGVWRAQLFPQCSAIYRESCHEAACAGRRSTRWLAQVQVRAGNGVPACSSC